MSIPGQRWTRGDGLNSFPCEFWNFENGSSFRGRHREFESRFHSGYGGNSGDFGCNRSGFGIWSKERNIISFSNSYGGNRGESQDRNSLPLIVYDSCV